MLAFIHIHKTAGTTVVWILRSSFGSRHCEPHPTRRRPDSQPWEAPLTAHDLRASLKAYPKLESISGHCVQPHTDLEAVVPDIQYCTLVRDPLKMRASMYQHRVLALGAKNVTLERWLAEEQSQNRQTKILAGCADAARALRLILHKQILVGTTESFDESMLLVQRLLAPNLNIIYRRMRVTDDNHVARDVLECPRTRAMLMEGNEQDMELYRVIRDEIYPEQRHRYGKGLDADLRAYQDQLAQYRNRQVSARLLRGTRFSKMAILFDPAPFNRWRLISYLFKQQISQRGQRVNHTQAHLPTFTPT